MNRRRLLLAAVAGTVGAGAGIWHNLGPALPNAELTLSAVRERLLATRTQPLAYTGSWSLSQLWQHLAQSVEFSMLGFPELKPVWFRSSVGPTAFSVFSARGAMKHGLDEAIPGAPSLNAEQAEAEAFTRLISALDDFAAWQGELQPHFAYGALSKDDYALAHALHVLDHWRLMRPA
ncbi:DUF1569 domain-containing protein [Atopomonas hussainii]|uniref:DUF1569 domain-containing protein n=1 Tax=Atopomonas hussainii TaxID=1429083 RepID=UPI0008FFF17C|nr:DUF1569 domain-containing protein [Atopomonas hussainii]